MKSKVEKELSTTELQERLDAERERLVKMKISHAVSPLENPSQIRELRKNIARILTELRAREIQELKK